MTSHLFLLLYITSASAYSAYRLNSVPHNYFLIRQSKSWSAAQSYCRQNYGDLATIVSDNDWMKVNKDVTLGGLIIWVGLYNDFDTWRWSYNDVLLKNVPFTNWYGGQPDNALGKEACGSMGPFASWRDFSCSELKPFVCFNVNLTGTSRFIGIATSPLNWTDARAYCQKYYTDLALVNDMTENGNVNGFTLVYGFSWIGLFRDTWKWSDGTKPSTIQWLQTSPDNNGAENCGALTGSFDDRPCDTIFYFLCHIVPPVREKQNIKIKLISDETVYDPAVQSAILELVRQKLEEHGMLKNTTVTWRVHSNGQIFQKKLKDDS